MWEYIHFLNDREGWVVGDGILHTYDGGKSWNYYLRRESIGQGRLLRIGFNFNGYGLAINYETVLSTTDNGLTWNKVPDQLLKKIEE